MVFINCFTEMWKENREVPGAFTLFLYSYKMIFLTVVACEIGRNSYFVGTDQRTGSGVLSELWVIYCTNSDPLEI